MLKIPNSTQRANSSLMPTDSVVFGMPIVIWEYFTM